MRKTRKALALLLSLCMVMSTFTGLGFGAFATGSGQQSETNNTITIIASKHNDGSGTEIGTKTAETIEIKGEQGTGQNTPMYYSADGGAYRFYSGNTFTVSTTDNSQITKIVFSWVSGYAPADGEWSTEIGSYNINTNTWEGTSTSIIFTAAKDTSCRCTQLEVTTEGGSTSTISKVEIKDIDAPITGEALDTSATCETPGVSTSTPSVTWKNGDTVVEGNAQAGTEYTANLTLEPDSTHGFANSVTAKFDDGTTSSCTRSEDGTLPVSHTFRATAVAPTIDKQPQDATVCEGNTATFSVEVGNTTELGSLTYQWQKSTDSGTTWTAIADATNKNYTISSVAAEMNGYKYKCLLTNTVGDEDPANATTKISNAATLTIGTITKISTADELIDFANLVNNTKEGKTFNAVLTTDIDMTDKTFTPIGDESHQYEGTFDGQGHKISNLSITGDVQYAGLFGYVSGGTIKNVTTSGKIDVTTASSQEIYAGGVCAYNEGTITNCYNTCQVSATANAQNGSAYAGGVSGYNQSVNGSGGTITNCYNTGAVSATEYAGGLCGHNYFGTITNCYNTGAVSATANDKNASAYAGGLCGCNYFGTITSCYNEGTGEIKADGTSAYAGGVCGDNTDGTITNCYNTGTVTTSATSIARAGGVCGYNNKSTITNCFNQGQVSPTESTPADVGGVCGDNTDGTITNCYNTGNVSTKGNKSAGGVCGSNNEGTITNCYNEGTVSATEYAGGLCGYNGCTITNCYNTGSVSATTYAGGVCGYNDTSATITNCYNEGTVSAKASTARAGGLCGSNYGTVTLCYWDIKKNTDATGGGTDVTDDCQSFEYDGKTQPKFHDGNYLVDKLNENIQSGSTWKTWETDTEETYLPVFGGKTTISAVSISDIEKPITDKALDTTGTCTSDGILPTLLKVEWYKDGTQVEDSAEAGTTYTAKVTLKANPTGYKFPTDATCITVTFGDLASDKIDRYFDAYRNLVVRGTFRATAHEPNITEQPKDTTTCEGNTAEFSVTANSPDASLGGKLSYQWQQSTDSGANWTDISGKTEAKYTTDATTKTMSGYQYRCVVTNTVGEGTETTNKTTKISDVATLTLAEPNITDNNGGKYLTLKEAFTKCKTGATLKVVCEELQQEDAVTLDNGKTITLDLNGKQIINVWSKINYFIKITNNTNLTIKSSESGNGIIWKQTHKDYEPTIVLVDGGTLTIESGQLEAVGRKAKYTDTILCQKGTVNINGGVVIAKTPADTDDGGEHAIAVACTQQHSGAKSIVNITKGEIIGKKFVLGENDKIVDTGFSQTYSSYKDSTSTDSDYGEFNISGGTFNGTLSTSSTNTTRRASCDKVNITGGTFNTNQVKDGKDTDGTLFYIPLANILADGYGAFDNGNDTWTAKNETIEVKTPDGSSVVSTLKEAFEKCSTDRATSATITLGADIYNRNIVDYNFACDITLDLNGHQISSDTSGGVITMNNAGAKLTIKDSQNTGGKITNSKNGLIALQGGGTLNIESGYFLAHGSDTLSAHGSETLSANTIACEKGNVTINGGHFVAIANSNDEEHAVAIACTKATANIESSVTITDGTFEGFKSDGKTSSQVYNSYKDSSDADYGEFNISGGTFNGTLSTSLNATTKENNRKQVHITGGTFNTRNVENGKNDDGTYITIDLAEIIESGYEVKDNGDNTYTVVKKSTPVTTYYKIKATATEGGEITPSDSVRVKKGKSQTFKATADEGYQLEKFVVDGKDVHVDGNSYTFENVTANHTIQAVFKKDDITVESIAVTAMPTKTEYKIGEKLDTTGLVITATYSDSTTAEVTGYTLSELDSTTAGEKTITVTYEGKTTSFKVTVKGDEPVPTKNGWTNENGQWKYYKDGVALTSWQQLDWSGGNNWFYFDANGLMQTGWQGNIAGWAGQWFYFNSNGTMATGWNSNIAGWEGQWFFFDCTNGVMKSGWHLLPWSGGTSWFSFNTGSGVMYTNCTTPDGYVVDANGVWQG